MSVPISEFTPSHSELLFEKMEDATRMLASREVMLIGHRAQAARRPTKGSSPPGTQYF
jgi:hypothetical protein